MKTKTPTKAYHFAVAVNGLESRDRESFYDRLTNAPKVVAVATTWEDAQAWIAQRDREQRRTPLVRSEDSYMLFEILLLDEPTTYVSKQDAARFAISIPEHKYALISNQAVLKI